MSIESQLEAQEKLRARMIVLERRCERIERNGGSLTQLRQHQGEIAGIRLALALIEEHA